MLASTCVTEKTTNFSTNGYRRGIRTSEIPIDDDDGDQYTDGVHDEREQ